MRLVMVTHAYPRRAGDVAGAFIARLAEALVTRGHTVAVVAPADHGTANRFTLNGVEVVQVRYAAPERENLAYTGEMAEQANSVSGLRAFLALVGALAEGTRAEARRVSADLVHAHWWIPGGLAATRGGGLPFALTLHGTDVALTRSLPARVLARRVLGRACRVTAVSSYLATQARRRTWRPGLDIEVTPLPVGAVTLTRQSQGGGGIACVGRLTAQKRVDLLLEAVRRGGLRARVTIIGDGPERAQLERRARELGLSQVRFTGAVPPETVPQALGDADVVACLGRHEGLGLAAAEALMLGIPVVVPNDGGGLLDIVQNGYAGRVVPPTAPAIAAALGYFLGNDSARAAAAALGATLRRRLAPEAVARTFEAVYARCA